MSNPATFKIHTSIIGAAAIVAVGEVMISESWKQTDNQTRKERAIIIPMECLKAPEVPESFRALVELALSATAKKVLKQFVNDQPNNYEMLATMMDRPSLTEAFMADANGWMTKQELENAWNASATWKRITSREEFKMNSTYQKAAEMFKDSILKLSAKPTVFTEDKCDVILAKLEPADLDSEFGGFVVRRLDSMKKKMVSVDDFSAL